MINQASFQWNEDEENTAATFFDGESSCVLLYLENQ
jgi:hypothetical protein